MNRKVFILLLIFGLVLMFFIARYLLTQENNLVPLKVVSLNNIPIPTLTPTPTPIPPLVVDRNSNLDDELDNLTPEDFAKDLQVLKDEASQF